MEMSEAEFSKLYEEFLPKIFGYVSRRIGSRQDVEDIVSSTFLRAVEKLRSFDPRKGSFKTWIYAIATNMMIDYFRSHDKKRNSPIEAAEHVFDPEIGPHAAAEQAGNRERVHQAIHGLPERHQKVLFLKYFSDLSLDELAEAFGVTKNNASVMIHRALEAFEVIFNRFV